MMFAYAIVEKGTGQFVARSSGDHNRRLKLRDSAPLLYVSESTARQAMKTCKIDNLVIVKVKLEVQNV